MVGKARFKDIGWLEVERYSDKALYHNSYLFLENKKKIHFEKKHEMILGFCCTYFQSIVLAFITFNPKTWFMYILNVLVQEGIVSEVVITFVAFEL